MIKIIIIIYLSIWLLISYIAYEIGFMKEWCDDPYDDNTPIEFFIMMLLAWWLLIIAVPLCYLFDKINDYFYDKFNK